MGDKSVSRKRGAPSSVEESQQLAAAVKTDDAAAASHISSSSSSSSSPSSSSSSSAASGKKKDSSSSSVSRGYTLSLQPQPPHHPFVNVWFPVQLFLCDAKKVMKTGWVVSLSVELCYDNGELVPDQSILELAAGTPARINGDGQVLLSLRLRQVSMKHENRNFFLRFSVAKSPPPASSTAEALTAQQVQAIHNIAPITTQLMTVIKHKLKITEQPPSLWYKCISLVALLVDEHEQAVQGREVPLKVSLCYEGDDAQEVKNQSILKFPSETAVNRIGSDGRVELKVRIEEVSKNHQKQAFAIKIAPDVVFSPANFDIAADVSTPVTVLSKRNKRRKKDSADALSPTLAGHNGLPSPMSTLANSAIAPLPLSSLSAASSSLPVGASASAVAAAASDAYQWCHYVHRGLCSLEWQHVGFEITEAGEVHLQRPLHRCPSCWVYKDAIRPATHDERCMLHVAKQKWNTVSAQLQLLMHLGNGAAAGQGGQKDGAAAQPAVSGSSRAGAGGSGGRRGRDDDEDSESSDDQSEGEQGSNMAISINDQGQGHHGIPVLPQVPMQAAAAAGTDDSSAELPHGPPSFLMSHSITSASPTTTFAQPFPQLMGSLPSFMMPTQPQQQQQQPQQQGVMSSAHYLQPAGTGFDPAAFEQQQPQHQHAVDGSMSGYFSSPLPPPTSSEVLVSSVHATSTRYGLPAFSDSRQLLGFYLDQHNDGVNFYPIDAYLPASYPNIAQDVDVMLRDWKDAAARNDPDVFWLKHWLTHDKLKEEAAMHLYTRQQQR